MDTRLNNSDVPIEVVFKWLVREKDHHKARVEKVSAYAKALEVRIAEMEKAMQDKEDTIALLRKQMEASADSEKQKIRKRYKKVIGQLHSALNVAEQFAEVI